MIGRFSTASYGYNRQRYHEVDSPTSLNIFSNIIDGEENIIINNADLLDNEQFLHYIETTGNKSMVIDIVFPNDEIRTINVERVIESLSKNPKIISAKITLQDFVTCKINKYNLSCDVSITFDEIDDAEDSVKDDNAFLIKALSVINRIRKLEVTCSEIYVELFELKALKNLKHLSIIVDKIDPLLFQKINCKKGDTPPMLPYLEQCSIEIFEYDEIIDNEYYRLFLDIPKILTIKSLRLKNIVIFDPQNELEPFRNLGAANKSIETLIFEHIRDFNGFLKYFVINCTTFENIENLIFRGCKFEEQTALAFCKENIDFKNLRLLYIGDVEILDDNSNSRVESAVSILWGKLKNQKAKLGCLESLYIESEYIDDYDYNLFLEILGEGKLPSLRSININSVESSNTHSKNQLRNYIFENLENIDTLSI